MSHVLGVCVGRVSNGEHVPGKGDTRLQSYWENGGQTWAVRLSHPHGAAPTENLLPGVVLSEDMGDARSRQLRRRTEARPGSAGVSAAEPAAPSLRVGTSGPRGVIGARSRRAPA